MRAGRFLSLLVVAVSAALFAAWPGASNSGGTPPNSAEDGCTCHGVLADDQVDIQLMAGSNVTVEGENLTVAMRLALVAPIPPAPVAQNEGGFAISVDRGNLTPVDGTTQLRDGVLTHTADGNDQREWSFAWVLPREGPFAGKFQVSVNAVNGDGLADPVDRWNHAEVSITVSPPGGGNATNPPMTNTTVPPTSDEGIPGVGLLLGASAAFAVAAWRRRTQ